MSAPQYQSLLVIIPTRNRAELAINAIRSVLNQTDCELRLLVSDNSTSEQDSAQLSEFCGQLSDERLRYIRPPEPLGMPEHWEWAMREGLSDGSVSHVTYLTDRMVFKSGELNSLLRLVQRYPTKVISYNNDLIVDYVTPVRLNQASWTGRLFELHTAEMLAASSRVCTWLIFSCLPRMLNCVVPRDVLGAISKRFGNLFLSTSPDLCFAFRCLERVDTILYYDKALLISYGHSWSNGTAAVRGIVSPLWTDFTDLVGSKPNYAAPIPELPTGTNLVIHEYCFVKEESQNAKFPGVDWKRYLSANATDIDRLEDPLLKRKMKAILEKLQLEPNGATDKQLFTKLHELAQKLKRLSPRWLVSTERPRLMWSLLQNHLGVEIRGFNYKVREFETVEDGLTYAERHPRAKNWGASLVETEMRARSMITDSQDTQ